MTDETTSTPAEETTPTPVAEETPATESSSAEATPDKEKKEEPKTEERKSGSRGNDRERRGGGRRGGGKRRQQKEPKEFEEAILQIDRVTRVVSGGRRLRFRISVVIGDQKGRVGFGVGKSAEVMVGIQKAVAQAKKNLINVPIFNGTIPHEMNSTFKSSRVLLFPAPEGKGVIAGGAVRRILELAGVKNVLSKIHGSRNKLNVAVATIKALQELQNQAPHGMEVKSDSAEATPDKEEAVSAKASSSVKATPDKSPDKKKPTVKKPAPKKKAASKKPATKS
jgi:small subunit ribosomal protein S5